MSDPNTPTPLDHSKPFADMAAKIAANVANGFGGAVVILSPAGKIISSLSVEHPADEALFWGGVKSRVEIVLAELSDAERQGNWPRR